MKKYILYTIILVAGLTLSWLFLNKSQHKHTHEHADLKSHENESLWTCSMHPQIQQHEPGDCPICGMELIPVKTKTPKMKMEENQFMLTENAMALANVQTTIVGSKSTDENTFKLSGKIAVNQDKVAVQPAHFNGRIEKLYVNSLGDKVNKGQLIAKVYSPELIAAQQELLTAYKIKNTQPKLYKAIQNKFKNWKIHEHQLQEVLRTGKVKTSFEIYAHVSGIVTEILVNDGAHIMDGKPIFKVSDLSTVWANFDVYENQISLFKKGQNITITTSAYPTKKITAKINFIDPVLDVKTRIVNVRAELNNKDKILKPGMFAEAIVRQEKSEEKEFVIIPASAVLWTGKQSVVYKKTTAKSPTFEMQEVTLGSRLNNSYQIIDGLQNGDEIVTNGTFTVDAAAQLQGKKSMMKK